MQTPATPCHHFEKTMIDSPKSSRRAGDEAVSTSLSRQLHVHAHYLDSEMSILIQVQPPSLKETLGPPRSHLHIDLYSASPQVGDPSPNDLVHITTDVGVKSPAQHRHEEQPCRLDDDFPPRRGPGRDRGRFRGQKVAHEGKVSVDVRQLGSPRSRRR